MVLERDTIGPRRCMYHTLAAWPAASFSDSVHLSLLICKTRILVSRRPVRAVNEEACAKFLEQTVCPVNVCVRPVFL